MTVPLKMDTDFLPLQTVFIVNVFSQMDFVGLGDGGQFSSESLFYTSWESL